MPNHLSNCSGCPVYRTFTKQIYFKKTFNTIPYVVLSFSRLRMLYKSFRISATSITSTFFYLLVEVWDRTRIHFIQINYLAYETSQTHIRSGVQVFNDGQFLNTNAADVVDTKYILFNPPFSYFFATNPTVYVYFQGHQS
jgi:hypothetical protein